MPQLVLLIGIMTMLDDTVMLPLVESRGNCMSEYNPDIFMLINIE